MSFSLFHATLVLQRSALLCSIADGILYNCCWVGDGGLRGARSGSLMRGWLYCTVASLYPLVEVFYHCIKYKCSSPHCSSVAHIFAPHMFIVVVVVIVVLFYFSAWKWIVVILKSTDRNFIWLHWWFALCLKSCLSETRQPSLSGCFKWCFWLSCWQQQHLGKHTTFKYQIFSTIHGTWVPSAIMISWNIIACLLPALDELHWWCCCDSEWLCVEWNLKKWLAGLVPTTFGWTLRPQHKITTKVTQKSPHWWASNWEKTKS